VQKRVHVVPPRTQADLLEWTASADAGIIPYHAVDTNAWYVSPNKLFEYIAAELPFLSNNLPYVKMVVEDTGGGMTADLTTPERCGKAINDLFADEARLQQLRANLHCRCADYLWKKQGEKLLQLYEAWASSTRPTELSPDRGADPDQ
jgi:glycosyltransferase involved in cell wall biosynthesis